MLQDHMCGCHLLCVMNACSHLQQPQCVAIEMKEKIMLMGDNKDELMVKA